MRGKYGITIQNKKIKYDFEIKRNITIIQGDSATGKTVLVDMVREYYENGTDSGIELKCDKVCAVLEGRNWKTQLTLFKNSIIFIDEGNRFVSSKEFATEIQKTDNYYVIVTREGIATLPYSVEEIYGIRDSGRYGHLKQVYNELYHIYGNFDFQCGVNPSHIITEDSNSGYHFFKTICDENGLYCTSANGKSNIFQRLLKFQQSEKVLVIADGAAFGPEIEKVMRVMKLKNNIVMYLPESFEWLILQSGVVEDGEVQTVMSVPFEFINSEKYFSWERFFTDLLIDKTKDSYLQYSKHILNPAYTQRMISDKILKVMQINFSWKQHSPKQLNSL